MWLDGWEDWIVVSYRFETTLPYLEQQIFYLWSLQIHNSTQKATISSSSSSSSSSIFVVPSNYAFDFWNHDV